MKEFTCHSCRRTKKIALLGETSKVRKERKICTACVAAKEEARKKLADEYGLL